jgi:hypothetical protein
MGEPESGLTKHGNAGMDMMPDVMSVDTFGGRVQVHWDTDSNATPMGQLAFFAEFLKEAGVFDEWVKECPLAYISPNAPANRDILGTWMLSALAGHRRYAHVTALRGDGVSPQVLGMRRIVSEDALRRALCRIDEEAGTAWMRQHLLESVVPALSVPWILDADTTIKTLYGRQEGAEIGYNPKKPGRPSHAYHTYWVGFLRLVLDVEVSGGKSHTSSHALPGLARLLDELPPEHRPFLVRGDCGFGNDTVLREMESRKQRYLFKLKQSKNVRRLLARQFQRHDWIEAGQGWEAVEDEVKLAGWEKPRRVVIIRRLLREGLALARQKDRQVETLFPELSGAVGYEYAVLVTDTTVDTGAIAQLYRDRADSENGFDEMKNQWGWGGYTTQDLARCRLTARMVALVYNWWSWYSRMARPDARLEAVTGRPLLLAAVGRTAKHGGQSRLYLTPMHAAGRMIVALIGNVRAGLRHVKHLAEQLPSKNRWHVLVHYIVARILAATEGVRRNPLLLPTPTAG